MPITVMLDGSVVSEAFTVFLEDCCGRTQGQHGGGSSGAAGVGVVSRWELGMTGEEGGEVAARHMVE